MELKICTILAAWALDGKRRPYGKYRTGEQGIADIEKIIQTYSDADILFLPGGFIVENRRRSNVKYELTQLCSGFQGILITGFDTRYFRKNEDGETEEFLIGRPHIFSKYESNEFRQAAVSSKDSLDVRAAREKRWFNLTKNNETISFVVTSCGEIFSDEFWQIVLKEEKPQLLFNCVHNGNGWQTEPCRAILNRYFGCAGFYNYHSNAITVNNLKEKQFSNIPAAEIKHHKNLGIAVLQYAVDTASKYPLFIVTRKIAS